MADPATNAEHAHPGEIWVLRHGQTDWSAVGRHTGRNDLPLNAEGEAQARELATRLAGMHFDRVICSPLQRAQQTCEIAGLREQAEIDPDAMEWNYGDYEGRTTADIREERPGWLIWPDGVVGGETLDDVAARARRVVARVDSTVEAGGRVAVFAHGHFLRIFTTQWIGQPAQLAQHLALLPARVSVLGFEHETHVITRWNS
jgi:probable phosphoglycerate mutase